MNINKAWMYARLKNGFVTEEYMNGVEEFVKFAKCHPECMDGDKLRCPCIQRKCRNMAYRDEDTIKVHLGKYGFVPDYYNWYVHGEPYITGPIGHSTHTSSAPIIEHALKLKAELKRKTDCREVFRSTHRHKDDTFVDARSQAINDNMTAKVTESSQTSAEMLHTPSQDDINNIYYDVVGGMKKSRLYGLGSQGKIMFPHAASTSRGKGRPSSSSVAIEELRSDNVELKARMVELEKTSAENTKLSARISELEKTMHAFMSRMVFSQANSSASSSPNIDSDKSQP